MTDRTQAAKILAEGSDQLSWDCYRNETRLVVPRQMLYEVVAALKIDWGFDLLIDITCVDYLNYRGATHRFGMVYLLASTDSSDRLCVRCYLDEPDLEVDSIVPLWAAADWSEREVWDMFGIRFTGHPDLRRILLPEEFTAHPLRKDYPLQGRGERHHFPTLTRSEA